MNPRWLGLTFVFTAVLAEAFAQASLKRAAGQHTNLRRMFVGAWPWVAIGIALFGIDLSFWTLALQRLDLSLAFPLQSLGLVIMAVIARLFLGETITSRRWLAIVLILAGTIMVGA